MSFVIDLIMTTCMANTDVSQKQGCKSLVTASYYQFKSDLVGAYKLDEKLDEVAKDLNNRLPIEVKTTIMIADAINNKKIYLPLYNKEF